MKKLAYLFILAGTMLLLFPIAREYYYEWEQQRILEDMERHSFPNVNEHSLNPIVSEYERLSYLFDENVEESAELPSQDVTPVTEMNEHAIAVISIDKIDLKLPVLEGATKQNMKVAAAHMTETTTLGEIGNSAIAAHRARTKGRLFNRLNELEPGDEIKIMTKDTALVYTVFNKTVVEPTDLSVLDGNNVDSILTLITCDPLVNPTHRLIVHARIE